MGIIKTIVMRHRSMVIRHLSPVDGKKSCGWILWLACSLLYMLILIGCASMQRETDTTDIIALVDGETISSGDLEYALQVAHRRELSNTHELRIPDFVNKLVDDRLIIQEARRMGMEEDPETRKRVEEYILRESVVRLFDDEIRQHISISPEEIQDYYREKFEKLSLQIIETDSENKAVEARNALDSGADFSDLAQRYSTHASRATGGNVTLQRKNVHPVINKAISHLQPGNISGITASERKFYIIKLLGREAPPDSELEQKRARIESVISNIKIKERSDEYLKYLHEKADPKINEDILSTISLSMMPEERQKWTEDDRAVVSVYDSVLTAGDFVRMIRPRVKDTDIRDKIIKQWLDRTLVDHEALQRNYAATADLKAKVQRYEDELIKTAFLQNYIGAEITITDQDLEEYHARNQKAFMKPEQYKLKQITVNSEDEARDLLRSIREGADFSWLAQNRSVDQYGVKGGDIGWRSKSQLSEKMQEDITKLNPGDVSQIIRDRSYYRIFKLLEKSQEEIETLNQIKPLVQKKVYGEKLNALYASYITKLRKDATIVINNDLVETIEKRFKGAQ